MNILQFLKLKASAFRATAVSPSEPLPVTHASLSGALVESTVTMTGASASLLAADVNRKVVIVSSAEANSAAVVNPIGGTAALDKGIPVPAGTTLEFVGRAAQSAMTQIGTNGQKLTVYVGT